MLGAFIFDNILCRWGAVSKIVTDNGTTYIAALDWLANRYGIQHICISAYNSQANSIVKCQHRTICESLVKVCEGDISKWPSLVPLIFWADCVTTCKSTGHSPFFMAHGVEPILLFNITLATFLTPNYECPLTTAELISMCARQLEHWEDDLMAIHRCVLNSHFTSVCQFEKHFEGTPKAHEFKPGDLVLVRNSAANSDILGHKVKPQYFGLMIVARRTCNGAYRLAKLDGTVSKLCYAAFRPQTAMC
jgi:hypothetical protein